MTFLGWLTIALFAIILTALAMPLGSYMARVYTGERVFLSPSSPARSACSTGSCAPTPSAGRTGSSTPKA